MSDVYIDIGSTNIKWKISGKTERSLSFPAPCKQDEKHFEVDAEKILQIVIGLLNNVDRAFFSVQMHGYVLLNKGKPVSNYVSWRDERGRDEIPNFTITKEYGVDIKPNLPRISLQVQKVEFDEFCTLGSYIIYRLTGANATHITDASPSGFYNVKKQTCDTVKFALPKAYYGVKMVGRYKNVKLYTPVGDQQSAILGAVGENYDGLILNLGTAAQACYISPFITGDFESRPYFYGKTLCTVTRLIGGAVIARYTDEELFDLLVEDYKKAIAKLPKNNKIMVTGGVVNYRKNLIEKVLNTLEMDCIFNNKSDALAGLEILAKGVS